MNNQGSKQVNNQESVVALSQGRKAATHRNDWTGRAFFTGAAALLLVLTVVGFRHFYLEGRSYPGRPITPPIRTLITVHGIAMALWMVLFGVQAALIAVRKHRVHMTLGRIGAVLAGTIVVLGLWLGVQSARVAPPDMVIWGLLPKPFMSVPMISVGMFGVFVGIGIWKRRRAAIHRPMMLLGTLSAMTAAISRIDALNNLYLGTVLERIWGPFFTTLAVGALLLMVRSVMMRGLDKPFAIGLAVLTVVFASMMQVAPTSVWDQFASLLVK